MKNITHNGLQILLDTCSFLVTVVYNIWKNLSFLSSTNNLAIIIISLQCNSRDYKHSFVSIPVAEEYHSYVFKY